MPDAYALLPAVWLWSFVAAGAPTRMRALVPLALLWVALATVLPFSGMPLPDNDVRLALSTFSPLAAIALSLWTILRVPARATAIGAAQDARVAA